MTHLRRLALAGFAVLSMTFQAQAATQDATAALHALFDDEWERLMREGEGNEASTVRQRLSALSSLFTPRVKLGYVHRIGKFIFRFPEIPITQG